MANVRQSHFFSGNKSELKIAIVRWHNNSKK